MGVVHGEGRGGMFGVNETVVNGVTSGLVWSKAGAWQSSLARRWGLPEGGCDGPVGPDKPTVVSGGILYNELKLYMAYMTFPPELRCMGA